MIAAMIKIFCFSFCKKKWYMAGSLDSFIIITHVFLYADTIVWICFDLYFFSLSLSFMLIFSWWFKESARLFLQNLLIYTPFSFLNFLMSSLPFFLVFLLGFYNFNFSTWTSVLRAFFFLSPFFNLHCKWSEWPNQT